MPFDEIMHKYKKGTLRSSSGSRVTSRKQALAIGLSYNKRKPKPKKKHGFSSLG